MLNARMHLVHCETEASPQKRHSGKNFSKASFHWQLHTAKLGLILRDLDWGSP
jgi:hypothetical protein